MRGSHALPRPRTLWSTKRRTTRRRADTRFLCLRGGGARPAPLGLLLLASTGIVYVLGAAWFYAWWTTGFGVAAGRGSLSFEDLMIRAVIPFIPLDLAKAGIVLGIGSVILPNRPFAREKDARAEDPPS